MNRRDFVKSMLAVPAVLALPAGLTLLEPCQAEMEDLLPSHVKFFADEHGVSHRLEMFDAAYFKVLHWEEERLIQAWRTWDPPKASVTIMRRDRTSFEINIDGLVYKNCGWPDPSYVQLHSGRPSQTHLFTQLFLAPTVR